jgi:hypothetical protein
MKSEKEKKSIDVPLRIWLNEETGHIHMNIAGNITTVNDKPESLRGNPKLYRILEEQLRLAGKIE